MKTEQRDMIIEHCQNIRQLYEASTFDERIILYDIEAGQMLPLPYVDFKSGLISPKSRKLFKKEYQDAQKHDKILVVVSDSKYKTIKTHTINRNPDEPFCMSELTRIF